MQSQTILIGSDPELFLVDKSNTYVSGHDLIPGTKHKPYPVPLGAIQVDGVALEFNTRPAETEDEFLTAIETVMTRMASEYMKVRSDLTIAITPTATFDQKYFDSLPDSAKELGCTPDFNAYTGEENTPPDTTEPFRTGSGHIHVGFGEGFRAHREDHFQKCCSLVKQLDATLYPASLLWDDDQKRRTLYGKIGAFRPKSYGLEYRSISNAYLRSKDIQRFVFRMTKRVSHLFLNEGVSITDNEWSRDIVSLIRDEQSVSQSDILSYLESIASTYDLPKYS